MATGEIKALYLADGVTVTAGVSAPIGVGGFGTSFQWFAPEPLGPVQSQELGHRVYSFQDAEDSELWAFFQVPASYVAGTQINLDILVYTPSTSGTIKLKATAYLIKKDTTAVSSTALAYSSTNSALTNATTANKQRQTTLDLCDSSGQIASIAIAAGDEIKVKITRDYTNDTDTAAIRLIADAANLRYGT